MLPRGDKALCLPYSGALSPAQMGHRDPRHAPAVLPARRRDPQDPPGQPGAVKDKTMKRSLRRLHGDGTGSYDYTAPFVLVEQFSLLSGR